MSISIKVLAQALLHPSDHNIARYKAKKIYSELHKHGVAEVCYKNFKHKTGLHDALAVRAKTSIATEMARAHELELLSADFRKRKIKYIVFKGTALAYFSYKNAWQRPRGDSDILIYKEQLDTVGQSLISLGYKAQTSVSGKYISYQQSFSKTVTPEFTHTIDVHWRVSNRQILANCYTLDELLENSRKIVINENSEMKIPSAIDSILLAVTHRKGHHAEQERLIWLYDIHLLCNDMEEDQWPMLLAKARNKKITTLTLEALKFTESLFSSPVPNKVFETLKRSSTEEPSSIFLDESKSELAVFWADAKHGLDSPLSRLRLLKEHLLPSRAYLKQKGNGEFWILTLLKRIFSGASAKFKNLKK